VSRVLFRNIRALLPEGVRETCVCVEGDRILAVGEVPAGFAPDTVVEGKDRLLIPGLVNAHTHAYMTMFRSCADDLSFTDWLFGHIDPLESKMTREDCYWATLLGYMEMLSTGTTACLDMYVFTETALRAAEESGFRTALSRGLTGGAGDPEGGKRRIREALEEMEDWKGSTDRIRFFLGPHAPYTCDPDYLREIADLAEERKLPLHLHLSESVSEQEGIREKYGCTPAEYFDRAGILRPGTVAAHCVYVSESDMRLLAERGVTAVTNPASNLKLGNGVAPVPDLLRAGVNVALGTDGAASNNALNLFRELNLVTLLHKGLRGDPTELPASQGLRMATENGARALGWEKLGRIEAGWTADLAVLDLDRVNLRPWNDILSSLAYASNGSEVESVMVEGKFLMKDREFLTIDRERVQFEVDRTCKRLGLIT
jgi:5-methylthioadenosine/S-adenosylhomocysteine deaminase